MLNKLFITIIFFFSFVTSYTQTTIHNTFGSGDSYDNTSSYGLTATGWIASEFTVGSPGYSNITAEAALAGTSNGNLTIEIYNDNGSDVPTGAALASGTVAVTFNDAVVSINFSSLSLNAGIYHLVAYRGTTDGFIYQNSESIMGVGTSSDGGSSWNSVPFLTTPAFRITGATALPVELVSFSAMVVANSVQLNWRTATETNNYGFEVQKSVVRIQKKTGKQSDLCKVTV